MESRISQAVVSRAEIMRGLRREVPFKVLKEYLARGRHVGMISADQTVGFCTPGGGNLAPPVLDPPTERMIDLSDDLARGLIDAGQAVAVVRDCHPGPEEPWPDHCIIGSGEELLVPKLRWLEGRADVVIQKDCIDAFVGSWVELEGESDRRFGSKVYYNSLLDWINDHELETVIWVGKCTDICVMQPALTLLSIRQRKMAPTLKDVVMYLPACTTYDLPREVAVDQLGLAEDKSHPRDITEYMALYFLAQKGAILAEQIII